MPQNQTPFLSAQEAYALGDLKSAERHLRLALQSSPDESGPLFLLGVVCARTGRRAEGIQFLQRALEIDPRSFEVNVALSTLLFADGQWDLGKIQGEQAIALQPNDPVAHHHLAKALVAHGRTEEAIPFFGRAAELDLSSPRFAQDLAAALTEVGKLDQAVALWKGFTQRNPRELIGWLKLGGMFMAARRFREAIECGQRAIALQPNSADALVSLGLASLGDEDPQGAETYLKRAIKARPNELIAHSAYGLALHEMGRFDEARPSFEMVLKLSPTNGQAYYSLIRTRKTSAQDEPLLDQLRIHLEHPGASVIDRSYMHYAFGKASEDLGKYEESIGHFDQATKLANTAWFAKNPFNREKHARGIQRTIDTFTPEFLNAPGRRRQESDKPLLVVGMIRSGTTMVEQILSSHRDIKGGGELTFWQEEVARIFDFGRAGVDEKGWEEAGSAYLELIERIGPNDRRVIDKMPPNYTMIGFLLGVVPQARVIYVKRNALDNALSIFTTAYQRPPSFVLDRGDIVFNYREHEKMMAHWKAVLPASQFLEVSYEEIIQNREEVTRGMIQFAGLEWDEACLFPELNERTVNTPSVWQVRQPIYKTSVERWRRFEPWLGELRELMI